MLTAADHIQFMNPTLYSNTAAMNYYMASATEELNQCFYGVFYQKALALYSCHLFTLDTTHQSTGGATTGPMVEYSEGPASVKFAYNTSSSKKTTDLESTGYGRALREIHKKLGPFASTASPLSWRLCQ